MVANSRRHELERLPAQDGRTVDPGRAACWPRPTDALRSLTKRQLSPTRCLSACGIRAKRITSRRASFTACSSGNTAATSGAKRTRFVPSLNLSAYFPRTPPLSSSDRSYSGRSSSSITIATVHHALRCKLIIPWKDVQVNCQKRTLSVGSEQKWPRKHVLNRGANPRGTLNPLSGHLMGSGSTPEAGPVQTVGWELLIQDRVCAFFRGFRPFRSFVIQRAAG
jgi:hypothetical protein